MGRNRADADLVAACIDGDVVAFTEIVERYQQLVCAVSYSACGDVALSEDIAQEVFVTAWNDLARLREPARLKGWLCSIARNLARDARRKRRREVCQADAELDRERDTGPSPLEALASSQREDVVWAALAEIPESYREPLVLFYREDKSLKQVASLLGLTIDNVKQRLSRGRKALRGSLAPIAAALLDSAPGKAFTASVIAAALAGSKAAAAATATRVASETLTAGEAVGKPAAVGSISGAAKLAAGAALAAIAVGVLWYLARPSEDRRAAGAGVDAFAVSAYKPLPTLYNAGVEPSDEGGDHRIEGVVVDVFGEPVAGAVVTVSGRPPRTTTTGEDGRFAIADLAARIYGVDAHTRSGSAPPVAVRVGAGTEPITLRIEPGSSLEITAIDGDTDEVMPGVEVEVESRIRSTRARTDAGGRARFDGITAHESEVFLRAPGYAPMMVTVNLSGQPGLSRRRLVLRRGVPVSGRIVDPDGRPVAGAEIYLDGGIRLMAYDHRGVKSDAEGRFAFDAVAPGGYTLHVDHPTWRPGRLAIDVAGEAIDSLAVALERGATVRGRVLGADGNPAAGAAVNAFAAVAQKRVTASSTGEFVLAGLPPGRVSITAESYPQTAEPIEVDLGGANPGPLTIRLAESCIRGRVVDGSGAPISGGQVRAKSWAVDTFTLFEALDRTDSRGRFALCRLQRGVSYDITAIADGVPLFFLYDEGSTLKAKPSPTSSHTIRLDEPGTVVGELAGDVPAEFGVAITRDLRGPPAVTIPFAETEGEFAISRVPPGTYTVLVSAEGRSTATHRDVEVRAGGVVELPPTRLARPLTIAGQVVDGAGNPVAGAAVWAGRGLQGSGRELVETPEGGDIGGDPNGPGQGTYTARSGDDGRFVLEVNERPNTPLLLVAERGELGRARPITSRVGATGARLQLAASGSLSGRVRGYRPTMVAAWPVDDEGGYLDMFVTGDLDPDGSYRFETLGVGRWIVVASGGDDMPSPAAPGAVRVDVKPDARVRRDLEVSASLPPWNEEAFAELDRVARAACECADEACRERSQRAFRRHIRGRKMPDPKQMVRTGAAIEVLERCLEIR